MPRSIGLPIATMVLTPRSRATRATCALRDRRCRDLPAWARAVSLAVALVGCREVGVDGFRASVNRACPPGFDLVGERCFRKTGPAETGDGGVVVGTDGGRGPVGPGDGGDIGGGDGAVVRFDGPGAGRDGEAGIPPVGPAQFRLDLVVEGAGVVRDSLTGGICSAGSSCQVSGAPGQVVTLEAEPAYDARFEGWTGACAGMGACRITLDADKAVTAGFRQVRWEPPLGAWASRLAVAGDNVYIGGEFEGTVEIGGTTLTAVGARDAFIAALDDLGQPRWAKRFGVQMGESVLGLAIGPGDALVMAGHFSDDAPLAFEGRSIPVDPRVNATNFLATFRPDGTLLSAHGNGGCKGLALDSRSNALFYPQYYPAQLAKKTLQGQTIWTYPETFQFFVEDMAVDASDSSIICTSTASPVTLTLPQGRRTVTPTNEWAILVVKLDRDGQAQWMTLLDNTRTSDTDAVLCDSLSLTAEGDVIVAGYYHGTLTGGSFARRSQGSADIFVARLAASNGSPRWLSSFGSPEFDNGSIRIVEDSGNLLLTPQLGGDTDFGGGVIVPPPGGIIRIAGDSGAVVGRVLPELSDIVIDLALHPPSGDYFLLDLNRRVSRVRLR